MAPPKVNCEGDWEIEPLTVSPKEKQWILGLLWINLRCLRGLFSVKTRKGK